MRHEGSGQIVHVSTRAVDYSSSGGGKVAGKYDKLRLEQLKNLEDYNATKQQLMAAYRTGEVAQGHPRWPAGC